MADTPTQIEEASKRMAEAKQAEAEAYNRVAGAVTNYMTSLGGSIPNLERVKQIAIDNASAVSTFSAFLFKTGENFKGLDDILTKSTGFRTYSDQIDDVLRKVNDIPGLSSLAQKLGMNQRDIENLSKGTNGTATLAQKVKEFAMNMAEGADNTKKFSEYILQQSANTGYLDYLSTVTDRFKNLNEYVATQEILIGKIQNATGSSRDQAMAYYQALSTIPNIFEKTVSIGGQTADGLAEVMTRLSKGSKIPLSTLKEAFETARTAGNIMGDGISADSTRAAEYLASLASTANNLKIEFSVVTEFTSKMASAFRSFGDEGIGSLKIMNALMPALRDTGLSAQNSGEMISTMTNQIANLNEAQKAFISQRTGGPGGLQGAFQIDELLREGKIDEVMKKVRETMKSQMGDLVSLKEAAQSPESAAQYERQLLYLEKGPLGQLAKDRGSAERLIDAFRAIEDGKQGASEQLLDETKSLVDYNRRGEDEAKRTETHFTKIITSVDLIQTLNREIAHNTAQAAFNTLNPRERQTYLGMSSVRTEDQLTASEAVRNQAIEEMTRKARESINIKQYEDAPARVSGAAVVASSIGHDLINVGLQQLAKMADELTKQAHSIMSKSGLTDAERSQAALKLSEADEYRSIMSLKDKDKIEKYIKDIMPTHLLEGQGRHLRELMSGITHVGETMRSAASTAGGAVSGAFGTGGTVIDLPAALRSQHISLYCTKCTELFFNAQRIVGIP